MSSQLTPTPTLPTNWANTTTDELLSSLRHDRQRTLQSLSRQPYKLRADTVDIDTFWQLFDDNVRTDGTVDADGMFPSDDGVAYAIDPITVGVAIAVMSLMLAAFSAGYVVGKDAADTDDADEASGSGEQRHRVAGHVDERSTVVFEPGRYGIEVRVATTAPAERSTDLSVGDVLAGLKHDRPAMMHRLRNRRDWRIVSEPIPTQAYWDTITAYADGGNNPRSFAAVQAPSDEAPEPMSFGTIEAIVVIAALTLLAFAVGVGVGYVVNDNEDPDSEAEPADESGGGDSGSGSEWGGAGHGLTGAGFLRPVGDHAVKLTVVGRETQSVDSSNGGVRESASTTSNTNTNR